MVCLLVICLICYHTYFEIVLIFNAVLDFSCFRTQAHYSETFEKQKFKKAEGLKMKRTKLENFQRLEAIATGFFILIVAVTVYGQMRVHSWDDPRPRYR